MTGKYKIGDTLPRSEEVSRENAKRMLNLSIEGFKRGLMFIHPSMLGISDDDWIEAAKSKIEELDTQSHKG